MRNAKAELIDVAFSGCGQASLFITESIFENTVVATRCEFSYSRGYGALVEGSLTSATFKNCVFNDNKYDGIAGSDQSTIHLHGEATAIHSNGGDGIYADSAKVIIHLPSHHNTSYNNGEGDRETISGGTITNVVED